MSDTSNTAAVKTFRRHVDGAAGIYARIDAGILTGRNSDGTYAALEWHVKAAAEIIRAEVQSDNAPVCAWLDSKPRSAARWNRIERRFYGLTY